MTRYDPGALALLLWFAVITALVLTGRLDGVDRALLDAVHQTANPTADQIWLKINWLGGPFFVAPATVVLALVLAVRRQWRLSALVALGVGVAAALNLGLRHLFHRPRPVLWQSPILDHSFVYGYPGGHATLVAALVSVAAFSSGSKTVATLGTLYVVLVGFSSLYLGVHYPTDLLAGWILGYLVCRVLSNLGWLKAPSPELAT